MRYAMHVLADSATSGKLPIHGPDFVAISVQQQLQIRMRTLKAQIAYSYAGIVLLGPFERRPFYNLHRLHTEVSDF